MESLGLIKDRQEAREAGREAAQKALDEGKSPQEVQQARKDAETKVKETKKSYPYAKFELIEISPPLRYKFRWYKKTKLYPPPYHAFKKIAYIINFCYI